MTQIGQAYNGGPITEGLQFIRGAGGTDGMIAFLTNNGTERMRILNNGNIGIGTSDANAMLDVAGQVKITGGSPGLGKVLTSDANGLATWESASATAWGLTGNAGTTPTTNFIGTTDNQALVFKVNNTFAGTIQPGTFANTSLGYNSMSNTTGLSSTAIGTFALQSNTTGSANTAVGRAALIFNTTGYNNTSVGEASMNLNSTGYYNTAVGRAALSINSSGNYNTALGYEAQNSNETGTFNLALGAFSDVSAAGLQNAAAIGANAYVSQSNSLVLGSVAGVNNATSSVKVGIGTPAPSAHLDVVDSAATDTRFHLQNRGTGNTGIELRGKNSGSQQYIDFTNNATGSSSPDFQNRIISNSSSIAVVSSDAAGVHMGIGTQNPHASAALEVASSTKGVLYPRMTTSQRDAIASPAEGLMLFNTTTRCLEMYGNNNWQSVYCVCANGTQPPSSMTGTFTGVCAASPYTYTVNAVPGALSYTWSVTGAPNAVVTPNGTSAQITFGSGTNNPTILVSVTSSCGTSANYSRTVSMGSPTLGSTTVQTPTAGTPTSFIINWSAVNGATGYYLDVSTDAGFTTFNLGGFSNLNVGNVTTYNVTGLFTCVTYHVRIRAYNTCLTGGNSNAISHMVRSIGSQTFNYTGTLQSFTVPSCVNTINVKIWAGGGGGNEAIGGGGAYVKGTMSVTGGSTIYFVVAGGGHRDNGSSAYGGGGTATRGGGGGYSGVFTGSSPSQVNAVVIAGGGGGGSTKSCGFPCCDMNDGGGGGGYPGLGDIGGSNAGLQGSSSAGGTGGTGGGGTGTALQGGAATGTGGGGGGGYYGGGGGSNDGGGGGGGTYTSGPGFTLIAHETGATGGGYCVFGDVNPGGTSDPDYSSGIGTGKENGNGGNGKIVITW